MVDCELKVPFTGEPIYELKGFFTEKLHFQIVLLWVQGERAYVLYHRSSLLSELASRAYTIILYHVLKQWEKTFRAADITSLETSEARGLTPK